MRIRVALIVCLAALCGNRSAFGQTHGELLGSMTISGNSTDLFPSSGVNANRLGGFGSSLHYDRSNDVYYGLVDRGAGGGAYSYETRVQQFHIDVDSTTGAIGDFTLQATIPLRTADGSAAFNGVSPGRLNGSSGVLGLSFDPEGMAVGPSGNFYIADEYGPALYEFAPFSVGGQTELRFQRSFTMPSNLLPRDSGGNVNYDAVRVPTPPDLALVSGRQENRGFEGVTIHGNSLWAVIQGPLSEEGGSNEGRRSRNTRLVEFDLTTGLSLRQVIYQLEDRADVNLEIATQNPDPAAALAATAQGRTMVLSDILALNDHEFLVLERENRGIGGDNPSGADPILSASGLKQIYRIDISGATDVSGISLRGTNALTTPLLPGNPDPPITIVPVIKTPFVNLRREILDAGLPLPEKIEGLTFGPRLDNGRFALIIGTDNDFSVTQAGTVVGGGGAILPVQYEIYKSGTDLRFTPLDNTTISYVNITNAAGADYLVDQGSLPAGYEPLPSYLYSFAAVPEPSTSLLVLVGVGLGVGMRAFRRRRDIR